jgi:hypothetical protein
MPKAAARDRNFVFSSGVHRTWISLVFCLDSERVAISIIH